MKILKFFLISSLALFSADTLRADDDPMCWTCNGCSQYLNEGVVSALSKKGIVDNGLCQTALPIFANPETVISGGYGSLLSDEEGDRDREYLRKCTYTMRSENDQPFGTMVVYIGLSPNAPKVCDYLLDN
jgi:hypothetical protein